MRPRPVRLFIETAASFAVSLPAIAQRDTRCAALDTSAAWYRKQKEWADEGHQKWTNDSLRTVLVKAAGLDAENTTGAGALLGYEILATAPRASTGADSSAIALLRALTQSRASTWPTRSVVGSKGVRAVWLLVGRDSLLERSTLHRMMEAGPDESPPAAVAMLEDRLRVRAGRKQLYGTQLVRGAGGGLEPAPLEDRKHVDLRREAAGLPPLDQSLCAARGDRAR